MRPPVFAHVAVGPGRRYATALSFIRSHLVLYSASKLGAPLRDTLRNSTAKPSKRTVSVDQLFDLGIATRYGAIPTSIGPRR